MDDKRKKEIISSIVGMFKMPDEKEYMNIVLEEDEKDLTLTQLKAHLKNKEIKNNNIRCDSILEVNEIN